jgi:hypothetical protein
MKISNETLNVLKNFATVNTNILVRPGNKLATISAGKNIFATAEVTETFDREFAVYDLNSLLGIITAQDDSDISFGDESLKVTKNLSSFEYYYADPQIIVSAPDKSIEVDEFFSFTLSKENLEMIMKAAAITSAPMFSVVGDGTDVTISVGDPATAKSNSYKNVVAQSDKTFTANLAIENLKVIPNTYTVVISEKNFIHFANETGSVKYWMALDKSSEINNG